MTIHRILLILPLLLAGACSESKDAYRAQTGRDHVWKEQTDALDRAKEADRLIQEAAEKRRRRLEEQAE